MQAKNIYTAIAVAIVILGALALYFRDEARLLVAYGWGSFPTHDPHPGCTWDQQVFPKSGVSVFLQVCSEQNFGWTYSEDEEGRISRTSSDGRSLLTIQVLQKEKTQDAVSVVNQWFSKLTPEQQLACEVQPADQPSTQYSREAPHPTSHKIRYQIGMKRELVENILKENDGIPSGNQYDYLCGQLVGARFTSSTPYFEFDDRTPDKYLLVGTLGNDDSVLIDLNSIRF